MSENKMAVRGYEEQMDVLQNALFQAQNAAIGLAHKVKLYETALEEIAWSNNSEWQQDRAKQVLQQNIEKLRKRYGERYTNAAAIARADK